jgi:DNA processing protein
MTYPKKNATILYRPGKNRMPPYQEAVYWLTLINESGLKLSRIKPIIQRWRVVEQRSLAELFEMTPLDWSTTFGLPVAEAQGVETMGPKLEKQAAILARWQAQGIETLTRLDPRYPNRLANALALAQQPLLLWAQGAFELLNRPGVAMLGSQEPDDDSAAELIEELMRALVSEEINLVSGYSRGLDRATFETMLTTAGGRAITVLPMGLAAFAETTSKLSPAVESGQIALVSPFAPETPFQENLADARNMLIDHLALALLIPHADDAAQARATAALERGMPVFVGVNDTAAHRDLIEKGALLLTDAGEVVELVQQAIIDAALQESTEEVPPVSPLATSIPVQVTSDSTEDYALRIEEVEPIDSDEALEILSLGGEIPDVLRQRLQGDDD